MSNTIENQRKLAEEYAKDVTDYCAPDPISGMFDEDDDDYIPNYVIESNENKNQVDVYINDGDGIPNFTVTLAMSKELKDGKWEKGSDEYYDRVNKLFDFGEVELIKLYGKDYFLTYDESLKGTFKDGPWGGYGYLFSVTGDVPDGYGSELDYISFD